MIGVRFSWAFAMGMILFFSMNGFGQRAIPTLMANTLSDIHQYRPESDFKKPTDQFTSGW
jgi:hypothetical protein